jgi:hypothetical protein
MIKYIINLLDYTIIIILINYKYIRSIIKYYNIYYKSIH